MSDGATAPPDPLGPPKTAKGIKEIFLEQDTLVGRPSNKVGGGYEWHLIHKGHMVDAEDRRRAKQGVKIRMIPVPPEHQGKSLDELIYTCVAEGAP